MATVKITARDSSTAMEEVSKKLGTDAFILSTKSKEGGVEIEATNDPMELKKFSEKPKKKFSNLIKKELSNVAEFPVLKSKSQAMSSFSSQAELKSHQGSSDLLLLSDNINKLTQEIRGMYITGSSNLSGELGDSSFVKLEQAGFESSVVKALSPAFTGLNFSRGRTAFMNALAKSLTIAEDKKTMKRVTFINGLSGVGKTTLTAKMIASQQSVNSENITLATLGYKNGFQDENLRSYGRLLNKAVLRLNSDNLMETLCSTKGKILLDVSVEPCDGIPLILSALDFLNESEVTSIVAMPAGSSNAFIRSQAKLFEDLDSELALTKLDESNLTSAEISEFFLNSMRINYLTGSKSILGEVSVCNTEILTQYLIENC